MDSVQPVESRRTQEAAPAPPPPPPPPQTQRLQQRAEGPQPSAPTSSPGSPDRVQLEKEGSEAATGPLLSGMRDAFGSGRVGGAPQAGTPEAKPAPDRPRTTAADMQRLFSRNMGSLDGDKDGRVSASEVDSAVQDPRYQGEDGEMLTILKQSGKEMAGLAGDDRKGVSAADMAAFHEMQGNVRSSAFAQGQFGALDGDRDGRVTAAELSAARENGVGGEGARGHLDNLSRNGRRIAGASNDEWGRETSGFSQKDLQAWDQQNHRSLVADTDGRMAWQRDEMGRANRDLYATPGDPTASIKPDAIRQGSINDCYFLSSLSSLAERDPGAIRDMIRQNENGSYTVTFPGDRQNPVNVNPPTDAQLMTYNHGSERGTWASVMESAYNKYVNENVNWSRTGSDLEGGGAGRSPLVGNHALGLLTGRSVNQDLLNFTSRSTTHRRLSSAVAEGRPATAWIAGNSLAGPLKAPNESGLQTGHEYGILGYDPSSRTVTVRNPYGAHPLVVGEPVNAEGAPRDGQRDGVFRMTLDEFYKNFDGVAYAE